MNSRIEIIKKKVFEIKIAVILTLVIISTFYGCGSGGGGGGGNVSPEMVLSGRKMVFVTHEGDTDSGGQFIDITNSGGGALDWRAGADVSWLTMTPDAGETTTETDTLTIHAEIAGLAVGRHTAVVTLSDTQATNGDQTIPVTLFVLPAKNSGITPVFVSFVSHNEDDERYDDVYDTQSGYNGIRNTILRIMELVVEYKIPFDYQTDWRFLKAIGKWETPELMSSTNNKNIIRYLKEDMKIAVDPHSHECTTASQDALLNNPDFANGCDYADVAYLIESFGVTPDPVVGGTIVTPPEDADWEKFRSPLAGIVYPDYSWQADIIWGGGSSQHVQDLKLSGVWRPKDQYSFTTDDPAQSLITIGNGGGVEALTNLIENIDSGYFPSGEIYTMTCMVLENTVYKSPPALTLFENNLKQLQTYAQQGKVIYANLSEIPVIWQRAYDSRPNISEIVLNRKSLKIME